MHVILRDVSKRYGDKCVLNELNLELNSGKCYAIVGASGIGKTTLLRLVADLEYPDSGSIDKPEGAIVSYAFQEPLIQRETVRKYCSAWICCRKQTVIRLPYPEE